MGVEGTDELLDDLLVRAELGEVERFEFGGVFEEFDEDLDGVL